MYLSGSFHEDLTNFVQNTIKTRQSFWKPLSINWVRRKRRLGKPTDIWRYEDTIFTGKNIAFNSYDNGNIFNVDILFLNNRVFPYIGTKYIPERSIYKADKDGFIKCFLKNIEWF